MNILTIFKNQRDLFILCLLLVGAVVLLAPKANNDQTSDIPKGAHGEATMEYQLQELDKLKLNLM